jgi:hypothetical protein
MGNEPADAQGDGGSGNARPPPGQQRPLLGEVGSARGGREAIRWFVVWHCSLLFLLEGELAQYPETPLPIDTTAITRTDIAMTVKSSVAIPRQQRRRLRLTRKQRL